MANEGTVTSQPDSRGILPTVSDAGFPDIRSALKKPWYFQGWFLCILFSMWLLIVPIIAGIALLILSIQGDKKRKGEIHEGIAQLEKMTADANKMAEKFGAMDALQKQMAIEKLQNDINVFEGQSRQLTEKITSEQTKLDELRNELIITEEEILVQSFGLYSPKYEFTNSAEYRARLEQIRAQQKDKIKTGTAATGNMGWTVNGSKSQGNKMVKDMQKLLIRAFNAECDDIIRRVKYNNFDQSLKRITTSHEAISKLGKIMNIEITRDYYNLKIKELTLSFEYQQKKQQEKEAQRALREQMREEAKLQKEIEAERRKLDKEQNHYSSALAKIQAQLEVATDGQKESLLEKQREIEDKLTEIDKATSDIDYREANQKAGYVYVISNIGAFGENVYKIGMTRRLTPEERVDELGDASVPFNFDIHGMIFSEDAPALEAALHRAFDNRKLNMVNTRREFFNVTLEEIKNIVRENYDKTVEFIDVPEAEQFRISFKMRENIGEQAAAE